MRNRTPEDLEGRLVHHLARVQFEDLPKETVAYAKLLIMDSLGVTFPGSRAPGCPEVVALARTWGSSKGGATLLVHGDKTTPPLAALANSVMMHALDFDDTLDASALHTFVSVLPAALATAESVGEMLGKQFLTALVLGVDVVCRLSLGIRRPLSWIRTATCGCFGAAAACARLLNLSQDGLVNAMGIVYSQCSGNAQGLIEGRLVKRLQPGFAAQAGLTSAFLAKAGITGSRRFLEGPYGFYPLYERGEYDPESILEGLGNHYTITDLSVKPYPCCRMTHASIDGALDLRDRIAGDLEGIEDIEVITSRMVQEMVGRPFVVGTDPQVDAQFSIPYVVSVALARGDVFLGDFEVPCIRDSRMNALAQRVHVTVDQSLPEKDLFHSRIIITMKNQERHKTSVSVPLGNPGKPLSLEQCREKFKKCISSMGTGIDERKLEELLLTVEHLEEVRDVGVLASLTGAALLK